CPERVLLLQVPLGQTLSLHPLRRRLPSLVRRLHWYRGPVRLPMSVHRRRASLNFPSRGAIRLGRTRDLPVLVPDVSARAQGLCPRGTPLHLAVSVHRMRPSASPYSVGVPEECTFAAEYPARTYPCQRFDDALASGSA